MELNGSEGRKKGAELDGYLRSTIAASHKGKRALGGRRTPLNATLPHAWEGVQLDSSSLEILPSDRKRKCTLLMSHEPSRSTLLQGLSFYGFQEARTVNASHILVEGLGTPGAEEGETEGVGRGESLFVPSMCHSRSVADDAAEPPLRVPLAGNVSRGSAAAPRCKFTRSSLLSLSKRSA